MHFCISSNIISFDYPSIWKVEYPRFPEFIIANLSDPHNIFAISLLIQKNADPSPDVVNLANTVTSQRAGTTIIAPFAEKFITGSAAAMGKLSYIAGVTSNSIVINHNGEVFLLNQIVMELILFPFVILYK